MVNIVQSCWNKHNFIDILKYATFFVQKFGDHEILLACKDEVEVSKYVKKTVGLFIVFSQMLLKVEQMKKKLLRF